jgi:hypothetical protein
LQRVRGEVAILLHQSVFSFASISAYLLAAVEDCALVLLLANMFR